VNIWTFIDLLSPCCLACGLATGQRGLLCAGCRRDLPFLAPATCRRCALPLVAAQTGPADGDDPAAGVCAACCTSASPLQRVVAATAYAFPVDALVRQLKFSGRLPVAGTLASVLLEQVQQLPAGERPQALLPVPLHAQRQRERGYNQAEMIARPVARALGIPLRNDALQRTRATSAQSGHDLRARQMNLAGAFAVTAALPAHVAIVDDVMTSGSTLRAVAGTLAEAGVTRVDAWVVARTL
jgi:ComF family protein